MLKTILDSLTRLESERNIKILYACETGSRAWGFPSPDSDYDVRMIYMHDPDWYLSLSEKKDSIEFMSSDGELDITGWDIRKSLRLIMKSNGAMLERVQSPIVYQEMDGFAQAIFKATKQFYSPIATLYHYLGMARKSFEGVENQEEVRLKTLFYALRASIACKWIATQDTMPPIVFTKMLDALSIDTELVGRIRTLIDLKSGKNEDYIHPAEASLNTFIRSEIDAAEKVANTLSTGKGDADDMDVFFRNVLKQYGA